LDTESFRLLVDLGARAASSFPESHGEVCGGDMPVIGMIERPDDRRRLTVTAQIHQWPQLLDPGGGDDLKGYPDRIGRPAVLVVLVHALAAGGETQISRY